MHTYRKMIAAKMVFVRWFLGVQIWGPGYVAETTTTMTSTTATTIFNIMTIQK